MIIFEFHYTVSLPNELEMGTKPKVETELYASEALAEFAECEEMCLDIQLHLQEQLQKALTAWNLERLAERTASAGYVN